MFINKKYFSVITGLLISGCVLAKPPLEILQSCINSKPVNETITMMELDGFGSVKSAEVECTGRFDAEINGQLYGAEVCSNQPYLIIANKKMSTATAKNYSMNPSVKPDIPILRFSQWWKITKADKSYLCIQAPLSDTGSAANSWQYYLVEDAFDSSKSSYNIYYYFFDRNVYKRF